MIVRAGDSKDYYLDTSWYSNPNAVGISFFMLSWDYKYTIGECIDSLSQIEKYGIDYEIVIGVENRATPLVLEEIQKRANIYPIKIVRYPFFVAKAGLENHVTPMNSVHSLVWFLNYVLFQTQYDTVFKWDADLIANNIFLKELVEIFKSEYTCGKLDLKFYDTGFKAQEMRMRRRKTFPAFYKNNLWEYFYALLPAIQYVFNSSVLHVQNNQPVNSITSNGRVWWEYLSDSIFADKAKEEYDGFKTKLGYSSDEELIARNSCNSTIDFLTKLAYYPETTFHKLCQIHPDFESAIIEEINKTQ